MNRIALQSLDVTWRVFQETGTVWENYAPDEIGPGIPAQKDFVGWTGIVPILYLLEYGVGLKPDAPGNQLVWSLRGGKRTGCERYRFNKHVVDLLAEPVEGGKGWRITIQSTGAFTLNVRAGGQEKRIDVKKGESQGPFHDTRCSTLD